MPLSSESRFSRGYYSKRRKMGVCISRFMDGSASITGSELRGEWPIWTADQRLDFCQSCSWLGEQADFPEILRFIILLGGTDDCSAIALLVATRIPRDEGFDLLVAALERTEIGGASNIVQAMAVTKHPQAKAALHRHLERVWKHPGLWVGAKIINRVGEEASATIEYLIESLGAPDDFEARARQLSNHICPRNRESCRRSLSKHYSWLK